MTSQDLDEAAKHASACILKAFSGTAAEQQLPNECHTLEVEAGGGNGKVRFSVEVDLGNSVVNLIAERL